MEPKVFNIYFKWAVATGIRIYPIPQTNTGTILKIGIENKGKLTIGEMKYSNKEVYEAIKKLYKTLYEKYNKNETN